MFLEIIKAIELDLVSDAPKESNIDVFAIEVLIYIFDVAFDDWMLQEADSWVLSDVDNGLVRDSPKVEKARLDACFREEIWE